MNILQYHTTLVTWSFLVIRFNLISMQKLAAGHKNIRYCTVLVKGDGK